MARRTKSKIVVAYGQKLAMVLPPSSVARGGPAVTMAASPPLPFSPWQAAHLAWKIGAPCLAVPLPAGKPVPSGKTVMSHGARSLGVIGAPRLGRSVFWLSAANTPAAANSAIEAAAAASLSVDMSDAPVAGDRPAGDGVDVLAREGEHRGRCGRLPALRHELRARRLHVAAFIHGAALQRRGAAVPAPRHAEARERLGQDGLLERRFAPALAAVGRDHRLGDASGTGIGDAGDLVDAGSSGEHQAGRGAGDERLHFLQEVEAVRLAVRQDLR